MKTINNKSELKNLVCTILDSADKTREKLQNMSTEDFLFNGKFGSLGTKWDNPAQDDDLREQIQQSMTMLMTCYAIDWFYFNLVNFNNTSSEGYFTINDGDKNGVDLSFKGKSDLFTLTDPFTGGETLKLDHVKYMQAQKLLCEIFTAKNPYNNNKIFHDLRVLSERTAEENLCMRFIFFCSPEKFSDTRLKCKPENIEIIKIDKMQVTSYGKQVYQRVNGEIKLVSGRHDSIQSEIIRVIYKIADSEHRAHIIHITPESLLRWAIIEFSGKVKKISATDGAIVMADGCVIPITDVMDIVI